MFNDEIKMRTAPTRLKTIARAALTSVVLTAFVLAPAERQDELAPTNVAD